MMMMRITIRFFGDLIPLLGRVQSLELKEGTKVGALSGMITQKAGGRVQESLRDHRFEGSELVILINGRNIATLDGPETALMDGDIVAFIPPFAGG